MQELEVVRKKIQNKYRVVKTDEDLEWNRAIDLCTNIINAHLSRENAAEIKRSSRDNDGWISVEERLPEEKRNPASQDFCEYQVTAKFGNVKDVRHYKYGNGHWRHGPGIVDEYVIAWRPLPEPYRPERSTE